MRLGMTRHPPRWTKTWMPAQPTKLDSYRAFLKARSTGTVVVTVKEWDFDVVEPFAFKPFRAAPWVPPSACHDLAAEPQLTEGTSYTLCAPPLDTAICGGNSGAG